MDKYDERIKLDIFKSQSTYQNDYKKFPIHKENCQRKIAVEETKTVKKNIAYQDHETYAFWRPKVHIPFNLLWRPKEITGTDPYKPFETPKLPESTDTEKVIKTRPRIYMSPALSIDDIDDPELRKLIISNMYTPEWTKAMQESAVKAAERDIPNTTIERSGDPVQLKIDLLPPLPENFRNIGKKWEDKQIKYTCDPTKTFWEYKDPPVKCGACNDPVKGLVTEERKREIRDLIGQDRLRLAHDEPIPGYAGYKPRFSYGVSLAKVDMPVVHPFLSVTQAITKRYEPQNEKK